jgi:hypothetical protein
LSHLQLGRTGMITDFFFDWRFVIRHCGQSEVVPVV